MMKSFIAKSNSFKPSFNTLSQKVKLGLALAIGIITLPSSPQAAVEQWVEGDWKVTRWGGSGADIIKCDMDSEGNVWFGLLNGGLRYFDGTDVKSFTGNGINQSHIFYTVYVDPNDTVFWSGGVQKIIKIFNKEQVEVLDGVGYTPSALGKTPTGKLYGYDYGPMFWDGTKWISDNTYDVVGGTPREMVFTSDTTFWLFNGGG